MSALEGLLAGVQSVCAGVGGRRRRARRTCFCLARAPRVLKLAVAAGVEAVEGVARARGRAHQALPPEAVRGARPARAGGARRAPRARRLHSAATRQSTTDFYQTFTRPPPPPARRATLAAGCHAAVRGPCAPEK